MKKRVGIALLVLLVVGLLAYLVSPPKTPPPAPVVPPPVVATPPPAVPAPAPVVEAPPTNPPVVTPPPAPVETNTPPPVLPVIPAPDTNVVPIAPVVAAPDTNPPPTVIESSGPPVNGVKCSMVRNLLTDCFSNGLTDESEVFYRIRAGYESARFGNTEGTWFLGANVYYRPQSLRDELIGSTNRLAALLIPDVLAEINHSAIESTFSGTPLVSEGVKADAGLFWPWLNWTSKSPENCPSGEIRLSLGPIISGGLEQFSVNSDPDLESVYYGGARLSASPDAFVEYAVGHEGGLGGMRRQLLGEIPIYRNSRTDFRYVLRGVWNTSSSQTTDIYEVAVLVEFPFEALEHPSSFRTLIPFVK